MVNLKHILLSLQIKCGRIHCIKLEVLNELSILDFLLNLLLFIKSLTSEDVHTIYSLRAIKQIF